MYAARWSERHTDDETQKISAIFKVVGCCWVYGRLSHERPRPMGGMPSVGVFLSDPSPYLRAAIFKE